MNSKIPYAALSERIRRVPGGEHIYNVADRAVTVLSVCVYPAVLLILFLEDRRLFLETLLIPASGFVLLSMFRFFFNAPRPYEVFGFSPVLHKNTKGKSFPSRHVFSIVMLAVAFWRIDLRLGICFAILAVILSFLRVTGGVHFLRDVLFGAGFAVAWGLFGFLLICR